MSEVHHVFATVRNPIESRPGDTGQVTEGFYTLSDGVLTMTDSAGAAVRDNRGEKFTHKIQGGEDARTIASRLTMKIYLNRQESAGGVPGFNRPLNYYSSGFA